MADSSIVDPLQDSALGILWRWTGALRGALVASAIAGLVVVGAGTRSAMFIIAEMDPDTRGARTESDAIVGEFTLDGTVGLLILGTIFGIVFGPVYLAVRRWLPVPAPWRGLAFGYGALVTGGLILINPDSVDFRIFEPVLLAIALFASLFLIGGMFLGALTDRFHPEPEYPPAARAPTVVAILLVIVAVLGSAVMAAGIAELVDKEGTCLGADADFHCIPAP